MDQATVLQLDRMLYGYWSPCTEMAMFLRVDSSERDDVPGSGGAESNDTEQDNGDLGRKPILDWNVRYRIALGVARAIAYLQEESLEWVLHCDIKPENILIGDDFCQKISDFGLAKLKKKEDMVSMSHIRGTRGYMAPEWVNSDQITPKADVYSFGMVLLEIVSGVRNFEIQGSKMESDDRYFPRWAFDKVFKGMNVEDILDRKSNIATIAGYTSIWWTGW
ncbi:hypothetical protein RJ639_017611 [Escallonia herrerae]|uniref:Protein kinase domain-containing protein n=1 Tax=Escallonia herrerae TaxID=1293975 RepID=A0AA88VC86_9ASTE|nr:hypothetical protein RJ639_017611 [Escallonia herrerae]